MRIAVLTLTRDRLAYTQHCFGRLAELAGCPYDHYVLDQGSEDGTAEWLNEQLDLDVTLLRENIGISKGMNLLLDLLDPRGYDYIVKLDNDCELLQENTLRDVCKLVGMTGALLSPRILGLRNPPPSYATLQVGDEQIRLNDAIGGIFLAAPASAYARFRYDERAPLWGTDDSYLCASWRAAGGLLGYVERLTANHYEGTEGQWERYPDYFARTRAEGKAVL